ncbi:hypothetical protein K438DRAFT_1973192 [Mycena galopus ATCC 62051]|nr:hypothetical protein K438DRAFT_1973192 [Mycena galopus ATCC 62051]
MASTTDVSLSCLCGRVQESGSLLTGEVFPVEAILCHCNTCRYSTGGLFMTAVNLRLGEAPSTTSLCLWELLLRAFEQKRWAAFSGIVTPQSPNSDVVQIAWQGYVGDTGDHQLANRLYQPDVPCYQQGRDESPPMTKDELLHAPLSNDLPKQDFLDGRCHCGAVSFRILPSRGWDHYVDATATNTLRTSAAAAHAACHWEVHRCTLGYSLRVTESSRQITGEQHSSATAMRMARPSKVCDITAAVVVRSFCGMCGATAFYRSTDMPQVINVAAGLLRATEGSTAATSVWWRWAHVYGTEEHVDRGLVTKLREASLCE